MTSTVANRYNLVIINGNQSSTTTIEPSQIYGYNAISFSLTCLIPTILNPVNLSIFYSNGSKKQTQKRIKNYINNI
jgi:hypothetical protein